MHIYILHYHLNRGGVTRVIENHLRGLATLPDESRPESVTILYGGRMQGSTFDFLDALPFSCSKVTIPELDYDEDDTASGLAARLREYFQKKVELKDDSVIHIHNHQLGKNLELPTALLELANLGWRLLLQIHDFSEELRPANYARMLAGAESPEQLRESLYPIAHGVHYATLNQGNRRLLLDAGLPKDHVRLLPNPVVHDGTSSNSRAEIRERVLTTLNIPGQHSYVLYPVRGIRRKNLGELLLWSMMMPNVTFGLTLAPMNPKERASYERWVQLSQELNLNVLFDVGQDIGLKENYAACDAVLTTSIAEGFGMVFLESYLFGRELFGRDLPSVTADFQGHGILFPYLYDSIRIPQQLVDAPSLISKYADLIAKSRDDYGCSAKFDDHLQQELDAQFSESHIDFAKLDIGSQESLLRKLGGNQELKLQIPELNECFEQLSKKLIAAGESSSAGLAGSAVLPNSETVQHIRDNYSLSKIGAAYSDVCQRLLRSETSSVRFDASIGELVLSQFLGPLTCFASRLED